MEKSIVVSLIRTPTQINLEILIDKIALFSKENVCA